VLINVMFKRREFRFVPGLALIACLCACVSLERLPPADFSTPGWRIQQGQAVWKPARTRPELAGELLYATNAAGGLFLQFTKTPFTLATVQQSGDRWQIDLGSGDFSRTGRGTPPTRFAWFVLPQALTTGNAQSPWQFERMGDAAWRLTNRVTGESLEGYLSP
jgi:hypothetical protein